MRRLLPGLAGAALIAASAWLAGCRDSLGVSGPAAAVKSAVIVSAPSPLVYVSLPPGTVALGAGARVSVLRTGGAASATMGLGGLDPLPVAARAGDTLLISIARSGGDSLQFTVVVPSTRPPVVVRTDPPPQKRDVPLNAHVTVIFSEPIDSTTLTLDNVRLLQGTAPVPGKVGFTDSTHVAAAFVPDAPLLAGTTYELVVTEGIRDLAGAPLVPEAPVDFTTAVGTATSLLFTVEPTFTATGVAIRPAVTVSAVDARGVVDPAFTGAVTIASASSGAPLGGATTVTAVDGVAVFRDLALALAGVGQRLVATAPGLRPDTSGAFSAVAASTGTPPGRIAFASTSNLTTESGSVVVMNGDGSAQTTIFAGSEITRPTWSPDGLKVAFAGRTATTCLMIGPGDYACSSNIYIARADGSSAGGTGLVAVTLSDLNSGDPIWSPDGSKIAFTFYGDYVDFVYDVMIVSPDGSGPTQVTHAEFPSENDQYPAWSPDGSAVAFENVIYDNSGAQAQSQIWIVGADGSGARPLLTGINASQPAWSPDGTKLLVSSPTGIAVATADGATVATLSFGPDVDPSWTPDGRVVFARKLGSAYKLYMMNADGSGVVQLQQPAGSNRYPAWEPATSSTFAGATRPRASTKPR